MNRDQKAAVIEQIAADISASQAIFAIDYRGITVAQADALRARLRDTDASFRVVKNSLTERAADHAGAEGLKPLLAGPTALTFARGDAAAAAKAIADFARTTQLLAFKGGLMDGELLSATDVTSISRLPSRDVLYGQLVGLIASPIAGLARTLNALIGGLAVGLGQVLEQRGGAPAEAAAPAQDPAGEEPAGDQPAGAQATEEPAAQGASAEEVAQKAAVEDDAELAVEEPAEPAVEEPAEPAVEEPAVQAADQTEHEEPGEPVSHTTDAAAPEASEAAVDEQKEN